MNPFVGLTATAETETVTYFAQAATRHATANQAASLPVNRLMQMVSLASFEGLIIEATFDLVTH